MDGQIGLTPGRASIGAWTVDRYIDVIRWPMIAGMVAIILVLAWWSNTTLVTGLTAFILGFIGFRTGRRGGGRTESFAAGIITGLILGLTSAVKKFIATPDLLWGINLISETLLAAAAGSLLSLAGAVLAHQFRRS